MHHYQRTQSNPLLFLAGIALGAVFGPMIKKKLSESDKANEMKESMRENYNKVVDEVTDKYAKAKGISRNELTDLVDDLKMHWGRIRQAWKE